MKMATALWNRQSSTTTRWMGLFAFHGSTGNCLQMLTVFSVRSGGDEMKIQRNSAKVLPRQCFAARHSHRVRPLRQHRGRLNQILPYKWPAPNWRRPLMTEKITIDGKQMAI